MANYIHGWRQEVEHCIHDEALERLRLEEPEVYREKARHILLTDSGVETYHAVRSFWKIALVALGAIPAVMIYLKAFSYMLQAQITPQLAGVMPVAMERFFNYQWLLMAVHEVARLHLFDGLLLAAATFAVSEAIARTHYRAYKHA